MTSNSSHRYWCFTYNNPQHTPDELSGILFSSQNRAQFLTFQKEQGANGTPHYQGYLELKRHHRFSAVRSWIPGWHIEPRLGTALQAISYANKEDTRIDGPWSYGDAPTQETTQGTRTDLRNFVAKVRQGKRRRELIDEDPVCCAKYPKFIDFIRSSEPPPIRLDLRVELYWGEPGTGKTRKAFEENPDSYIIPIGKDLWFDGYDMQETLILDDFTGWMKLDHLLRLLDIYPIQVPYKGGFTYLTAKKIIITSNKPVEKWYDFEKHGEVKLRALQRRIHHTTHFHGLSEDPTLLAPLSFSTPTYNIPEETYDPFFQ